MYGSGNGMPELKLLLKILPGNLESHVKREKLIGRKGCKLNVSYSFKPQKLL